MQHKRRHLRTALILTSASGAMATLIMHGVPSVSASQPGGRSLYVSNSANEQDPPGQGANVARFTFDATGLLSPMETVPACAGARGLVFTPDLRFAYLSCVLDDQIGMFSVAADGVLTSIGQVDFREPFGIAIAPNGHTLYVGSAADSALAAFHVGSDGLLTLLNSVDSGGTPPAKGVAVTPDGQFVYVGHGAPADTAENVLTGFALGGDGSLQGQVAEVTNGIGAAEVGITPNGRFLYVASGGSDLIFGYQIGVDGGLTAVPGSPYPSGDNSEGIAISPDGRWIYVAAPGFGATGEVTGEVLGWAIGADGALTEVERLTPDAGDRPVAIELAPDGRRLYVGDFADDEVIVFRRSARGELTAIQTADSGGTDPGFQGISILPNQGPVASFAVRPGPAGSASRFDGTASSDPDGTVARYAWDFGDGTSLRNGGPTPHHVYRAPGTYRTRLTVIDDEGCSVRLVFTGQLASCLGTRDATTTRTVKID